MVNSKETVASVHNRTGTHEVTETVARHTSFVQAQVGRVPSIEKQNGLSFPLLKRSYLQRIPSNNWKMSFPPQSVTGGSKHTPEQATILRSGWLTQNKVKGIFVDLGFA